jgi:hypothetical protein
LPQELKEYEDSASTSSELMIEEALAGAIYLESK